MLIKDRKNSRPRLTVEVTDEQYTKLKKYLEHGMQRRVFSAVIDDMILMLEEYGDKFVVAMLMKEISYRKYMEAMKERLGDSV